MSYNEDMTAEESRPRFVAALLAWHDVSPEELGRLLGLSRAAIYKKLHGTRAFTTKDLVAIAEHFGVDPGLLLQPEPAGKLLGQVRSTARGLLTSAKGQLAQVRALLAPRRAPVNRDFCGPDLRTRDSVCHGR